MSLPRAQITGTTAEAAVEHLFLSWGWNVGHDRIDAGYDLHVTPDRTIYKGYHFSVQVKGTAQLRSQASISAKVSKSRLRQYAEDFSPVFIVRAAADGALYWVHAQTWAQANQQKMGTNGYATVRFCTIQNLLSRDSFESYLKSVFQSPPYASSTPNSSMHEAFFLNTLDPRLIVKIQESDQGKVHQIFARDEGVTSDLSFTPTPLDKNIQNFKEAIEFGLPRSIEVEDFNIKGSPLFEHITQGSLKGALSMYSHSVQSAKLRLYPGKKPSITSHFLSLDAERFSGSKGVVFTNERLESHLSLSIRFSHEAPRFNATATIELRNLNANNTPAREIDFLRDLGLWADQVIKQNCFSIEISIFGLKLPLLFSPSKSEEIWNFVYLSDTVRKIHLIAKATNSNIILPNDFELTSAELEEINLAYSILKGESKDIHIEPLTISSMVKPEDCQSGALFCTTTLRVDILEQTLCAIPILVQFIDFKIEIMGNSNSIKLEHGATGIARASYAESFDFSEAELAEIIETQQALKTSPP